MWKGFFFSLNGNNEQSINHYICQSQTKNYKVDKSVS